MVQETKYNHLVFWKDLTTKSKKVNHNKVFLRMDINCNLSTNEVALSANQWDRWSPAHVEEFAAILMYEINLWIFSSIVHLNKVRQLASYTKLIFLSTCNNHIWVLWNFCTSFLLSSALMQKSTHHHYITTKCCDDIDVDLEELYHHKTMNMF